jgi:hypothetical protein
MKRVVVSSGLHESEIRPPSIMSEFKRLSLIEAQRRFGDPALLEEVPCPACASDGREVVFVREGFRYCRCSECRSVFVSPRPSREALADYFRDSEATRYRGAYLMGDTANARRFHLLSAHADWLGQITDEMGNPAARHYLDRGTSLPQLFDEVRTLGLFDRFSSLGPLPAVDRGCVERGAEVLTDPPAGVGAITAFEQLEHQYSPRDYLAECRDMLAPGGLLFFTTRTISGFDLIVLWDKTPYIFVPEHLNLLSIDGITELLARSGFDLVELSTPGQLDLELARHAAEQDPSIQLPPFVRYLLAHRGREAHEDFQAFLQKHRLSSHLRVAAVKPEGSAD